MSELEAVVRQLIRDNQRLEERLQRLEGLGALKGVHAVKDNTTNTVKDVLLLKRGSTGTAADGIGVAQIFVVQDASGNEDEAGNIDVVLTTAAHATEAAIFYIGLLGTNYFRVTSAGAVEKWSGGAWVSIGGGGGATVLEVQVFS